MASHAATPLQPWLELGRSSWDSDGDKQVSPFVPSGIIRKGEEGRGGGAESEVEGNSYLIQGIKNSSQLLLPWHALTTTAAPTARERSHPFNTSSCSRTSFLKILNLPMLLGLRTIPFLLTSTLFPAVHTGNADPENRKSTGNFPRVPS